jgi:hypothetical protein
MLLTTAVRFLAISLGILLLAGTPAARADTYGLPVPRGTRQLEGDRYTSGKGLRDTVELYVKELDRRGIAHRKVGPYRVRGVDVARFLLDEGEVAAVQVYRIAGRTLICFVKRARS